MPAPVPSAWVCRCAVTGRLPLRPAPSPDELLSSWLQRLAHANVVRLSFLARRIFGDSTFWESDPDRLLAHDRALALHSVTGVSAGAVHALTMQDFVGRLYPALPAHAQVSWITPLRRQGYLRRAPGLVWCPDCLREDAYVRRHWRLSCALVCPEHGVLLRDACPHCGEPFAPLRHDLGRGRHWLHPELPFRFCAACEGRLDAHTEPAPEDLLSFQRWVNGGLREQTMVWPDGRSVPTLEAFAVLHQVSSLVRHEGLKAQLDRVGLPGLSRPSERCNSALEDHSLEGRRVLLGRVAWLIGEWPTRLLELAVPAGLTRRPMMANFGQAPLWFDQVADRLNQGNGRRKPHRVSLVGHLTQAELEARREGARSELEQRRWEILCAYAACPEGLTVARQLNVRRDLVTRTVNRYNERGPEAVSLVRGRVQKRRLLTLEDEEALRVFLMGPRPSNVELADWFERRIGRRPDPTTLWMYRRGVTSHSIQGRKPGWRAEATGAQR